MSDNGKTVDVRFGAHTAELDAALKTMTAEVRTAAAAFRTAFDQIGDESLRAESRVKASAGGIGSAIRAAYSSVTSGVGSVVGAFRAVYNSVFSLQSVVLGLATGGFVSMVKGALETAAAIKDVGNAASVSRGYLQEMRFAASQNGASAQVLDDALIQLNKRLGDLRTSGVGPAAQALKQLGLDARVMSGDLADTEQVMDELLRVLAQVPSDADRAALASDLFGRAAGPQLAEFLKTGEEGIRAAREEARRLGLVLSDEMIDKADEADDKLNALWETLKTAGVAAIVANAEAIKNLAEQFAKDFPAILDYLRRYAEYWGILSQSPARAADVAVTELENSLNGLKEMRRLREEGSWYRRNNPFDSSLEDYDALIRAEEAALAAARQRAASFNPNITGPRTGGLLNLGGLGYGSPTADDPFKIKPYSIDIAPRLGAGYDAKARADAAKDAQREAEQQASEAQALAQASAQAEIEIERNKEQAKLDIWRSSLETRHKIGTVNDDEYIRKLLEIEAEEYAIRQRALERELGIEGLKPQQRLEIQTQLAQLELDHQARMAAIKDEAARLDGVRREAEMREEKKKNAELARERERQISETEGLINRLLSSEMNAQSLLLIVLQEGQKMFARLIAERIQAAIMGEAVETGAKATGAATRTGIAAGEAAAQTGLRVATAEKSIMISAAEVFANVYAYLSPYMGPFAVVPAGLSYAAVLAGAVLPSAAGGTEVERDGIHYLHKNEVVLPAVWSQRLATMTDAINPRAMIGRPTYPTLGQVAAANPEGKGLAQQGFAGRPVYISGMDGPSIYEAVMRHAREMGQAIHRIAADGHVTAR